MEHRDESGVDCSLASAWCASPSAWNATSSERENREIQGKSDTSVSLGESVTTSGNINRKIKGHAKQSSKM